MFVSAELLKRPPLGREGVVIGAAQQLVQAVLTASSALEVALTAASRSMFPAYLHARKNEPQLLTAFLQVLEE